jgi:hypothetical protein
MCDACGSRQSGARRSAVRWPRSGLGAERSDLALGTQAVALSQRREQSERWQAVGVGPPRQSEKRGGALAPCNERANRLAS